VQFGAPSNNNPTDDGNDDDDGDNGSDSGDNEDNGVTETKVLLTPPVRVEYEVDDKSESTRAVKRLDSDQNLHLMQSIAAISSANGDAEFHSQLRSLYVHEVQVEFQKGMQFGNVTAQAIDTRLLWDGMDEAQRMLEEELFLEKFISGSTILATTGVAASYLLWVMRGSYLLALVASSLPTWAMVDPLPILDSAADFNERSGAESLLNIATRQVAPSSL
jgi:hypothetical protein